MARGLKASSQRHRHLAVGRRRPGGSWGLPTGAARWPSPPSALASGRGCLVGQPSASNAKTQNPLPHRGDRRRPLRCPPWSSAQSGYPPRRRGAKPAASSVRTAFVRAGRATETQRRGWEALAQHLGMLHMPRRSGTPASRHAALATMAGVPSSDLPGTGAPQDLSLVTRSHPGSAEPSGRAE